MDIFSATMQKTVLFILFLLSVGSSDPSEFISEDVLGSQGSSTGRSLLQMKTSCQVSFESMNYTIFTSRCKGPHYNRTECCDAFKRFACPHSKVLNDLSNDCASTMFSYINLNGKYPPGLFANICTVDVSEGLSCPPEYLVSSDHLVDEGGGWTVKQSQRMVLVLVVVSTVLAFFLS